MYFLIYNFVCFVQNEDMKVKILGLSTAHMKTKHISYVIFQATSQFFFKFWITVQCHDRQFLWKFRATTLCALDNSVHQSKSFRTLAWLGENSSNSSCHIWNQKSAEEELKSYRGDMSHGTEEWCKIEENWFLVSKTTRIFWILIRVFKSFKNLLFNQFLLCKIYKF